MKNLSGIEDIELKTKREIENLKKSGSLVAKILKEIASIVKPGIRTATMESICVQRINFYRSDYRIDKYLDFPTHLSVSVNDTAVHGIPDDRILKNGDIVTLDLVLRVDGWYGDSAVTVPVGAIAPRHARLIDAAREATAAGIQKAVAGNRIGDIGAAIQRVVRKYEARVFEQLVGHGVGRTLHEGPVVFMKGEEKVGQPIVPGMVFTIEPVVTRGNADYNIADDGHSIITGDGAYTAMFEHMIAVLSDRTLILTE